MGIIERKFNLQVPSTTENLAMIREFAAHVGAQAGMDESAVSKLELAVDEACANVIEHAYGSDTSQEVTVRADFRRGDPADLRRGHRPALRPDAGARPRTCGPWSRSGGPAASGCS